MTVVISLARTAISTNPHTSMTTYDYTSVTTQGFIRSLNHVERKFSDICLRQIFILETLKWTSMQITKHSQQHKLHFDCITVQLLCRIQKYSDAFLSEILFPFFSWTKSSDNIWLRVCVYYFFALSKMYCSQGDRRFRFLLNRFWAAPPFCKVCWLALLTSHHYRKLSKKQGRKLDFVWNLWNRSDWFSKTYQGRDAVLPSLLHANTHSRWATCMPQDSRDGEGIHSKPRKNVGFTERFQRKLTRNQFNCPKPPTACLQEKWK